MYVLVNSSCSCVLFDNVLSALAVLNSSDDLASLPAMSAAEKLDRMTPIDRKVAARVGAQLGGSRTSLQSRASSASSTRKPPLQ